jgi:hypothetical protein
MEMSIAIWYVVFMQFTGGTKTSNFIITIESEVQFHWILSSELDAEILRTWMSQYSFNQLGTDLLRELDIEWSCKITCWIYVLHIYGITRKTGFLFLRTFRILTKIFPNEWCWSEWKTHFLVMQGGNLTGKYEQWKRLLPTWISVITSTCIHIHW